MGRKKASPELLAAANKVRTLQANGKYGAARDNALRELARQADQDGYGEDLMLRIAAEQRKRGGRG